MGVRITPTNLQCKLFSDNEDYRLECSQKRWSRIDPAAVCYRLSFNTLPLVGEGYWYKGYFPTADCCSFLSTWSISMPSGFCRGGYSLNVSMKFMT